MGDLYIWVCCAEPEEPFICGVRGHVTIGILQEIEKSLTDGYEDIILDACQNWKNLKFKATYTEADPEPAYYDLEVVEEISWIRGGGKLKLSECCRSEITTKFGTEYPDGPIGITYAEEVCSKCGEPAFEIQPTCGECAALFPNLKNIPKIEEWLCEHSGREMNPLYKAGECKFFQWREVQLTIGGEDIGEP